MKINTAENKLEWAKPELLEIDFLSTQGGAITTTTEESLGTES